MVSVEKRVSQLQLLILVPYLSSSWSQLQTAPQKNGGIFHISQSELKLRIK